MRRVERLISRSDILAGWRTELAHEASAVAQREGHCRGEGNSPPWIRRGGAKRRGGWFKLPIIGGLNQPPRLRELLWLREIFLIAQPPLLIQGGEFALPKQLPHVGQQPLAKAECGDFSTFCAKPTKTDCLRLGDRRSRHAPASARNCARNAACKFCSIREKEMNGPIQVIDRFN